MSQHRFKQQWLAALLVVGALVALSACGTVAQAQTAAAKSDPRAIDVVESYLKIFNAGMISGDFSALSTVYAADATLTLSSPKGVTTVVHGLSDIITFEQSFQKKVPGYQWTIESIRGLAPDVVLVYQHAGSPPLTIPGRCSHLFVVEHGKITTYDWVTYYPGQA
jgi:hypothetical protein